MCNDPRATWIDPNNNANGFKIILKDEVFEVQVEPELRRNSGRPSRGIQSRIHAKIEDGFSVRAVYGISMNPMKVGNEKPVEHMLYVRRLTKEE